MSNKQNLENILGQRRILENEPLALYTTLRIGGPAQYFFKAQNTEELVKAINASRKLQINFYIIGGGSNLLISDHGVAGLVIRNESNNIGIIKKIGKIEKRQMRIKQILIEVDSGVMMNRLIRFACNEGWGGLEIHLGLPGTVGGAIFMNSKWAKPLKYIGDVLYQAVLVDNSGKIKTVNHKYFKFDYDYSILQKTREIILKTVFLLNYEKTEILWEKANTSIEYRKISQPMGVATAGCTFMNISMSEAMRIATPNNTQSAGFLLDQVGLRNFQAGSAKFSDKHANFIINCGGATAGDVLSLIKLAQYRVKQKFGIDLKTEIELLGKFNK
jgi:UDP-N-acetylenolpyruvoylglucosamine reductase